ncbi:MAG: LacI family transcriptional regulator [Bacteroidia bacterium]|nr:LacI family transcriptional regulator [Bacteroidia bacterium]NNF31258.1 LacI family DNA-binding transcriptional regulator [Flavobacteriaceae bacterium]MBT8275884.1 LacI family transcriptional regulator [Bacteroidia bacterium]NNJ82943.1 LacI family DNA-binding transcriptional regulator [Flavobacteriaceae bacterium]NNK54547.1 LacI family DNA-binding transcriptional regulator [Flavobacteriaceae bacterium]
MQKLTLKKIARELDVSISTVSKSLKDSPEISEDTRQKVKAFAKLYNYRPNTIALSLKNRKTKTIGVIIPEIVHHFFTTVVSGIEKVANEKGYTVIIGLSNESFDKEVTNMEKLANGSIDGFILSVSRETQLKKDYHHLKESIDHGMPVVLFDRTIPEIECDKVVVDDTQGAKNAVLKLISSGCTNIALITTEDHVNVGKLRTSGYQHALEERGIDFSDRLVLKLKDEFNEEGLEGQLNSGIELFLRSNPDIDAIFAVNEKYALTAMKAARALGKQIPSELKVVGFTDGVLSKYATPSLTTVSQHGIQLGEKAAELLIRRLEEDDYEPPYQTVVVETRLIERESTSQG